MGYLAVIQNESDTPLSELSEQHVNRAESRKMMREVFPPDQYGYDKVTALDEVVNNQAKNE